MCVAIGSTGRSASGTVATSVVMVPPFLLVCRWGRRYGRAPRPRIGAYTHPPARAVTDTTQRPGRSVAHDRAALGEAYGRRRTPGLPRHPQLRVDVRQVAFDRPDAQTQPLGDGGVRQPLGDELEDLELTRAELLHADVRAGGGAGPEEAVQLRDALLPRRLVQQDVIGRVQQRQPRARDERGEQESLLDRDDAVAATVQHERAGAHLRCERRDVEVAARVDQRRGVLRRGGRAQKVLEPLHLLRRAVGEEQHAERAAERGFGRVPAGLDGREESALLGGLAAELAAARVAAVEDQVGDTVWMARRVGDRDRGALRDAQQREALDAAGVDDRLEVSDPRLERRLAHAARGQTAATLVVAHDRVAL